MLWPLTHTVISNHHVSLPRSWYGKLLLAPSFLAVYNIDYFFVIAILFLVVAFFVRPNYIVTTLFFWLTLNLYIVFFSFANGSDLVLFMLALWCIPMVHKPMFQSELGVVIQKTSFNLAAILCQLQIVFIYLISGWDKLLSEAWRSGEAFDYVMHLDAMYNPLFTGVFENAIIQKILSWLTILFELSFGVLVWIRKTRLPILAIGIVFHLFIWIVMSLPDFAAIMMISYIAFLKDKDLIGKSAAS